MKRSSVVSKLTDSSAPGHERAHAGRLDRPDGVGLARPRKPVPLSARVDILAERLPESVKVDLPLAERLGE